MNHDFHSDAHKDPDSLEREIDAQRQEINETLRALEAKFSSRELTDQFMRYIGGPGREWAGHLGGSVKANPLPTVLTAIGVTWLMMCDRNSRAYSPSAYGSDLAGNRHRDMFEGARDAAHSAHEKASELGEKAAQAGEAMGEKASHAREAFRARAAGARDELRHSAASVRDNVGHIMKEQPLALGALGIALGAIIGAALPRTEHESRVMGRASERVMDKGKEMAREGYEQASEVATEVAQAAEETLRRQAEPAPQQTPGLG